VTHEKLSENEPDDCKLSYCKSVLF